jgi:hypothetical protein
VAGSAIDRDFSQLGSPQVTPPGSTIVGLAGSYALLQNVRHTRSLRLQMKTDNLLDADYERVVGFP